jgi:hypothetical protein
MQQMERTSSAMPGEAPGAGVVVGEDPMNLEGLA